MGEDFHMESLRPPYIYHVYLCRATAEFAGKTLFFFELVELEMNSSRSTIYQRLCRELVSQIRVSGKSLIRLEFGSRKKKKRLMLMYKLLSFEDEF